MPLQIGLALVAAFILHGDFARKTNPSVPQNVKLKAINFYSVQMKWDPPPEPYGHILGYIVTWYLDNERQDDIHLPPIPSYVFTGLQPGQTISAYVRALTQKGLLLKHRYASYPSRIVNATTPHLKGEGEGVSVATKSTGTISVTITNSTSTRTPVIKMINKSTSAAPNLTTKGSFSYPSVSFAPGSSAMTPAVATTSTSAENPVMKNNSRSRQNPNGTSSQIPTTRMKIGSNQTIAIIKANGSASEFVMTISRSFITMLSFIVTGKTTSKGLAISTIFTSTIMLVLLLTLL